MAELRIQVVHWVAELHGSHLLKIVIFFRSFPHNIRAIMAKIKLPEKPGGMLLF